MDAMESRISLSGIQPPDGLGAAIPAPVPVDDGPDDVIYPSGTPLTPLGDYPDADPTVLMA
jgi:hypothetical protein